MGRAKNNLHIVLDEDEASETTKLLSQKDCSSVNEEIKAQGRKLLRNVFVISLAFMVHFTASSSIGQLQSSINPDDGLGVYSRASAYGAMLFSALFLPTFFIQKFSAKYTIIFAMLGFTLYMGAQFHPTFSTLLPTGIIMGLSAAPLWSAKSTYVTVVAQRYAQLMNDKEELIIIRFFGIFSFLFQTSKIWGNILASSILSTKSENEDDHLNKHLIRNVSVCGINFCPSDAQNDDVLPPPSPTKLHILLIIYVSLAFAGVAIIALFLDPLKKLERKNLKNGNCEKLSDTKSSGSGNSVLATFRQMLNPIQLLIIPLTLWSGLEQGFFIADFYQAYVTCSWGVENLGYIIICYGVCNSLSSICLDPIVRRIGRFPIFVVGSLLNLSMIATMFKWHPDPNPLMLFVVSGIWGIADSIWHTQLKGLYGALFPGNEESAFSNYTLWESVGFIMAFTNGNLYCVNVKTYILLGVLSSGMIGYFIVEIVERVKTTKK